MLHLAPRLAEALPVEVQDGGDRSGEAVAPADARGGRGERAARPGRPGSASRSAGPTPTWSSSHVAPTGCQNRRGVSPIATDTSLRRRTSKKTNPNSQIRSSPSAGRRDRGEPEARPRRPAADRRATSPASDAVTASPPGSSGRRGLVEGRDPPQLDRPASARPGGVDEHDAAAADRRVGVVDVLEVALDPPSPLERLEAERVLVHLDAARTP